MKPKLIPCVKRWGILIGWSIWRSCRKHGCHGRIVDAYSPDQVIDLPNRFKQSTGIVKVSCYRCESVNLIRIYCVYSPLGIVSACDEHGRNINLLDQ